MLFVIVQMCVCAKMIKHTDVKYDDSRHPRVRDITFLGLSKKATFISLLLCKHGQTFRIVSPQLRVKLCYKLLITALSYKNLHRRHEEFPRIGTSLLQIIG